MARTVALKVGQFLAIVLTALAFVPAGAHLFSLLNKIGLTAEQYYIAQGIYRGWNLFGLVLFPAVVMNLVLAIMQRRHAASFRLALLAFVALGGTVVVFFVWTEAANRATDSWTTIPANWAALRLQWEYSHAASAVLAFVARCAATLSVLARRD